MSRQVLFNGFVLTRPGASTAIDASQFQNVSLPGIGIIGLIGAARGGTAAPRTFQVSLTPEDVQKLYGSGDIVEAAFMAANPSSDPIIQAGAQAFVTYQVNNATQSTLQHPPPTNTIHTFTSLKYGPDANLITVNIATDGGSGRVVTITDNSGPIPVQEVSPDLGLAGKLMIQYTGAGSAAALTISATHFTVAVTGASDGVDFTFVNYPTLAAIIAGLQLTGSYTVTSLITGPGTFDPSNLDALSAVDIKTAAVTVYSENYDVAAWINSSSMIITDTLTKGKAGPTPTLATTALSGASLGSSANTDWSNGLLAMRSVRVNQMCALASADGTSPDTYTFASVFAALSAHVKFVSSTIGRNECQAWAGQHATKTNLISSAISVNDWNTMLCGQQPKLRRTSDGTIMFFPEWATAVLAAGMRCGAPLGEPLTWKFINSMGFQSDASWAETNDSDVTTLELNGVFVANSVYGRGFRWDKMITTYTATDNDALTEETVVQDWKQVAFDLRQALNDEFVGRPGTVNRVSTVPTVVAAALSPLRDAGVITDSIVNGVTLNAWRNVKWSLSGDVLTVSLVVTPTPGINFVLTTIVLVPAQISGAAA